MTNKPNQSNKGTPNSLAELGSTSIPSSVTGALSRDVQETQRYMSATSAIGRIEENEIWKKVEENRGILGDPEIEKQYSRLQAQHARALAQQDILEESNRNRKIGITQTAINQSFSSSSINGQVASRLGNVDLQQGAMRASTLEPATLQKRMAASDLRLRRHEEEASRIASQELVNRLTGEVDPEKLQRLQEIFGQREQEINRRTTLVGANKLQKAMGIDPESVAVDQATMYGKAQSVLGDKESSRVEKRAASELVDAFKKLGEVVNTTGDEYKEATQNFKKAEENFVHAANGGGGGGRFLSALGFAGAAANAIGTGFQQVGVNQQLAQLQNKAGFANIENQKYQLYKAAAGGDISSLLMLNQFAAVEGTGARIGSNAQTATGANAVGSIFETLLGGATAIATRGKMGGGEFINGVTGLVTSGFDWKNDVSKQSTIIAGTQNQLADAQASSAIFSDQLQVFSDYTKGMGMAATGMGTNGEDFLKQSFTDDHLQKLREARLSPEQEAQYSQWGVNNIGSTFKRSQIIAARNAERASFGTTEENLHRMATLSAAGANNPEKALQSVMETAFSKGLEGSKVLNMVAENTAAVAQSSAGRMIGLNMDRSAAIVATAGIDPNDPNKEFAVNRSKKVSEVAAQYGNNISVGFAGMTSVARITQMTGLTGINALAAQTIDTATLRDLQGLHGQDLVRAGRKLGLPLTSNTGNDTVNKIIEANLLSKFEVGGASSASGVSGKFISRLASDRNFLKKVSNDKGLTPAEEEQLTAFNAVLRVKGGVSGEEYLKNSGDQAYGGPNGAGIKKAATGLTDPDKITGPLKKSLDDMRTTGFVQLTTAAQTATKILGGTAEAVTVLAGAFKQLETSMPQIEKQASTAAAKSAGSGGINVVQFNLAIGKLDTVLTKIMSTANISLQKPEVKKQQAPGQ